MRRILFLIAWLAAFTILVFPQASAIASDISDALYSATVRISNNGTTATNVFTTCNISTQELIDGGYINDSCNNTALLTNAGADTAYMPAVTTDNKCCIYVSSIGQDQSLDYRLYLSGSTNMSGKLRYFPSDEGMTTTDNASLEPGDTFTIEQKGWIDTDNGSDKNLVDKPGAFRTWVSGTENITSGIVNGEYADNFTAYLNWHEDTYDTRWIGQIFTANTSYSITGVRLPLYGGDVGTCWVGIRAESAGKPTGVDTANVSFDSTTVAADASSENVTLTFTEPVELTEGTEYAIVLRAPSGDAGNRFSWRGDSTNGYKQGHWVLSSDSGDTWTIDTGEDFVFDTLTYTDVTATGVSSGEHTVTANVSANVSSWATGNVLHFEGTTDDEVNCGAIYNAGTKLWVSLWFKLDNNFTAGGTNRVIWTKRKDGGDYILLRLDTGTGKLRFFHVVGAGLKFACYSSETSWTAGQWYHIISSMSDNGTDVNARLIVDGGTPITDADAAQNPLPNGGNFMIGDDAASPGGGIALDGIIANVITGTDDLTPAEETALYNGIAPSDETDYWYLDKGKGVTIDSYGSASNNGTAGTACVWTTANYTSGKTGRLCDFTLQVDDNRWGTNLKGATVPDNSANWTFLENNVMPYSDNISISVNGTTELWFRPTTMIIGDNLPDRATSATNNGTFVWGSNPADIAVSLGSMVSSAQPAPGVSADTPTQDILPEVEVTDWFIEPDVSGTLQTNPMRPFVTILSDTTTLTELQAWRLLALAAVLFVTVLTAAKVRGHHAITGIVGGASLGGMVALTIFPMWSLVFAIGAVIAGLIAERSPSL